MFYSICSESLLCGTFYDTKGKLKILKIFFPSHNVCFVSLRARKNVNILVQKLHFPLQNIGRKIRKNIFLFLIFVPLEAG